jgi:hypothetical protein
MKLLILFIPILFSCKGTINTNFADQQPINSRGEVSSESGSEIKPVTVEISDPKFEEEIEDKTEGDGWISGSWSGTKLGGVASKVSVIYALALDASGNVLAHGMTSGNLHGETFHGGTYDFFLAKRDSLGTYTSNLLFGGPAAVATASEMNVAANGDIF